MLYLLFCTASRTRGIIWRKLVSESILAVASADNSADAMEQLRCVVEKRYGSKIGKWHISMSIVSVAELIELKAIVDSNLQDNTENDHVESAEPVEAGREAGGDDAQPEAEGSVRGAGVGAAA